MNELASDWGNIAPLVPKTPFPTKSKALRNTHFMHTDFIGGMAVDDKLLVTSSEDHTVKVFNRSTMKPIKSLGEENTPVNFVAFSEDGGYLATADDLNKIVIYQKDKNDNFTHHRTLHGHTNYVSKLAFAGDKLVSASKDGKLKVWHYRTGALLHTLEGHQDWVYALATSPDGTRAISSALNSTLIVWDIKKGILEEKLLDGSSLHYVMGMTIGGENPSEKGNKEAPNDIAWIGDKVVTVATDIAVWDTTTWQIVWHQDSSNKYKIKRIEYIASLNVIITVGERIEGWELDTGRQVFSVIGHEGEEIYSCALWNEDILYTGAKKGDIRAWNLKNLLNSTPQIQHTSYVYTLAYLPEAERCITTAFDGTFIIYDQDAKPLKQHSMEGGFGGKVNAILPQSPTKAVICSEGKLHIIDTLKAEIAQTFVLNDKLVNFDDVYCLSDTQFLGTTLSYLPRLIDLETNAITLYDFPFAPTHFVPFGKKLLFTSYPTSPLDVQKKEKYRQDPISIETPTYKTVKGLEAENRDLHKTSCFFMAQAGKMQDVKAYWLPDHVKLNQRYDKSYPMYAYPIDKALVAVHYSGNDLVIWDIPQAKVIVVLGTEEEYLPFVCVRAGKLYAFGKSGKITKYNTQNFQVEAVFDLACPKTNAHTLSADQDVLLFSENETYLVAWDLKTETVRFKVNLNLKINKIALYENRLFIGTNEGKLFAFEI